jgi:hypothetical protein
MPGTAKPQSTIEAVLMQSALDDHYREIPETRPSPSDLKVAAAELDGRPLDDRPEDWTGTCRSDP